MPRPGLERTIRYIPVVPRANSKPAKAARRGSQDLRRLVGHANFLDTLMNELSVDSVEAEVVTEEEPTATASTGESQTLHWNDLQNDAETESSSDEDEEEEGMAPESDHENIEEHAQGRMQYYVVEKAKAPVHTIPVVTPELEHPTAVAKECLEEDEVVVTDGTFNKGARVVVPEAEDHFDKIGKRTGAIVAKA